MKVSVIIPAFNVESTIEKCVVSVLNQTYKNIELIVVDDGSKDRTVSIISRIKDKKLKVIKQDNRGSGAARNTGLRAASGSFVMFVDADDAILPNMVETLVRYQQEYQVDLIKSGLKGISANGLETVITCKRKFFYSSKNEIHTHFFEIFSNGLNSPVGKLYRLSILKKNEILFDEELALTEDLHFNLRYLEVINSALFIPEVFYQYYLYNSTATTKYRENLFVQRKKAIILLEHYLIRNSLDKSMIPYLYIKLVFASAIQEIEHKTPGRERIRDITQNLRRQEVKDALTECHPSGILEKVLYKIIKLQNSMLIDLSARVMLAIKKCSFLQIKRISV